VPDTQGGWPVGRGGHENRAAGGRGGAGASKPRPPRRITASYLERSALHHCERYPTTTANLRRVLGRRADRSCEHHGSDRDEAQALIEAALARLVELGVLDDRRYAGDQARRMRGRGASSRRIRAWLGAKGVSSEICDAVLREEAGAEADLGAAWTLARRRRIGPYRTEAERPERRERDLAILARNGFSFHVATSVIDATDPPDAP
jgi:regulatory protein